LFWVYLRGIETYFFFRGASFLSTVLSLPTRDWNSFFLIFKSFNVHRFESTYEGLKLSLPIGHMIIWASFESTYEGLKHTFFSEVPVSSPPFWVYLRGIETMACMVFIIKRSMFWVYLRGIETPDWIRTK